MTGRWPTAVCDGTSVIAPDGRAVRLTGVTAGAVAVAAERLYPSVSSRVVWVTPRAHELFSLPPRPAPGAFFRGARTSGSYGWTVHGSTHLGFPRWSGEFKGLEGMELLAAAELFSEGLGLTFAYSAPSTIHHALLGGRHSFGEPDREPGIPWRDTVFASPAGEWGRKLTARESRLKWVRAFDRSGSYLSAWSGCKLPTGDWLPPLGPEVIKPGPESDLCPGYYLVDPSRLWGEYSPPWYLPDFLARRGASGPVWITAPLLQVIRDWLAGYGCGVPVESFYVTDSDVRALDKVAERMGRLRAILSGRGDAVGRAALGTLKEGYAGAVAWFEHGAQGPLARPAWRRTVIDRFVANTWRNLSVASPPPFALTDVDTAFFALGKPDEEPAGLRLGTALGAWKPKGDPIPMKEAKAALKAGGVRGLGALAA